MIDVNVDGIGVLSALVDTGAKVSALTYDCLNLGIDLRPARRDYRSVDGTPVTNVVGETDLIVRFDGAVVHLNDVVVLEEMSHPLLLGIDFVANGNILISGSKGVATVTVQRQPEPDVPLSIDDGKIQTDRFTIEDVKQKIGRNRRFFR